MKKVKLSHRKRTFLMVGSLLAFVGCSSNMNQQYGTGVLKARAPEKVLNKPQNASDSSKQVVAKGEQTSVVLSGQKDVDANSRQSAISRTFEIKKSVEATARFKVGQAAAETLLTMQSKSSSGSTVLTQITKPVETQQFVQGSNGEMVNETLTQEQKGVLDLLVVVDDSASMAQEQKNLSSKLQSLLSHISNSSWRIGVITTSASKPELRAIINKGDVDAGEKFAEGVSAGISGSGQERGIYQSVTGLKSPGFLRDGSSIAVLIVSDEENYSSKQTDSPQYLLDYLSLTAKRKLKESARIYGIISPSDEPCETAPSEGLDYEFAIDQSGGTKGSICDEDYSNTLSAISTDVKAILQTSWYLSAAPAPGSLSVKVNGVTLNSGYSLVGQTLSFSVAPQAGSKIEVSYAKTVSTSISKFNLNKKIVANSETVTVAGQKYLRGTDYTVSSGTVSSEIVFIKVPPSGALVNMNYKVDAPLLAKFMLSEAIQSAGLTAKVNGESVPVSYEASTQSVVFNPPPSEGSKIDISYQTIGVPALSYSIGVTDIISIKVLDDTTKMELPSSSYTVSNGLITFSQEQFVEGRKLRVITSGQMGSSLAANQYKLPAVPDWNPPMVVKPDSGNCVAGGTNGAGFYSQDDILTLQCGLPVGSFFNVIFSHTMIAKAFDLSPVAAEFCDKAKWNITLKSGTTSSAMSLDKFERKGCVFVPKAGSELSSGQITFSGQME